MVMGAGGSLADAAARGYPTTHRTAKAMAFWCNGLTVLIALQQVLLAHRAATRGLLSHGGSGARFG